jgi:hypothetical protein
MKRIEVEVFEKTMVQLDGLHQEMSILAKKSPNDALNNFKLKFVNSTLRISNQILGDANRPFPDFSEFSEEEMPSNSDVTFILSQYLECSEKFRADNIKCKVGQWYWRLDDPNELVDTAPPKKINKKG